MERVENKVFKVRNLKNGLSNLQDFEKIVDKKKVYELGVLDEIFGPKRVFKCAICKELTVESGEVNVQMDLFCEETMDGIDPDVYPFMHFGCLALGFMGLGSRLDGQYVAQVVDTRRKEGSNVLSSFRFRCKDGVSAYIDFPDFCVATTDIMGGFTISIRLRSEGIDFMDGSHPLALNVVALCRFMDDKLETKMLIKKHGKRIYQAVGQVEILDPEIGNLRLNDTPSGDVIDKTMFDVAEIIRKIRSSVGSGASASTKDGRGIKEDEASSTDAAQREASGSKVRALF
ncbi:movement protein [Grapevine virus G]|uniref:Movement protein n=2 Tax=Grapevine virus G TaxID=2022475 RepID=A0A2H4N967_9VIRU|nr:movement protein [Grapevine virus G]ATV81250.1 movement protein [Grapevine virus G]ATV81263.1 movement protein [Grapevine virus G]ATV81268.1 movement protein [Grapevine virus G]